MDVVTVLLLEEEQAFEDHFALLKLVSCNEEVRPMFRDRQQEGAYNILVLRHLIDNGNNIQRILDYPDHNSSKFLGIHKM
jgi:hypothetical protein